MSRRPARAHVEATKHLTLEEAAEALCVCGKTLASFLKSHPAEPPFFARMGRKFYIEEFERRLAKPQREDGLVYFVQAKTSRLIKIGFAFDPKKRVRALTTGSTEQLLLLGSIKGTIVAEREIHKRFSTDRRHGEWFSPSKELLRFINQAVGK